jgi:integrase
MLIKPDNWSNETQQARQRADVFRHKSGETEKTGRKKFNDRITGLRTFIEGELEQAHQADINTEWLKTVIDKFWYPEKFKVNLFSFIQSFIDKSLTKPNPKTGRPVCYKMRREYEVTFKYLKEYSTSIGKVIDFKNINLEFYDGLIQFLQGKKLATNTVGKKVQTLKIFLNSARESGLNPYEGYKSKKFVSMTEDSEATYLNESELTKIYEYDFKDPTMERVRDLFLVGCWTGCRFSDISQITPESVQDGFIHLQQHKTGTKVIIPLHPVVTSLLNKYEGLLPKPISNQKFNTALKTIAELAGIKEPTHKAITKGGIKVSTQYKKFQLVTTHTARRSFATNLYKAGLDSLTIRAITGHKTEQAFLKYIKVTPDEHARKLQLHWNNQHLKVV